MAKESHDLELLKSKGFLAQRQDDHFSMRLHTAAGNVSADHLRAMADAAEKFGDGYVHVTSRQGFEIPFVHLGDTEQASEYMTDVGIGPGASGKKVRAVVACQGNRVCKRGLIDCQDVCEKIDAMYFADPVPYKFKIAVTGCPASCLKVQENDFGIMGTMEPQFLEDNCAMCGLCEEACKVDAITITEGNLYLNRDKCILCGDCISACRKDAMQVADEGFTIFIGGKVGKRPRIGNRVLKTVDEAVVFDALEKTLNYYRENAHEGERLGDVIDRCGLEHYGETIKYSLLK
ncbi:4Fe-4S binding protein [Methanolobus sp. ZRKC3]|uniref:4Fe-4S binding protein n=1 Tax=Methanolobus sp. ZRKC3 TaxID=3125786 RepID=UPI00324307AD